MNPSGAQQRAETPTLCPDQVDYLYDQLGYLSGIFLLLGLSLGLLLWPVLPAPWLGGWLAANSLLNGLRWYSLRCYRRRGADADQRRWLRLYLFGAALSGVLFGALAFFLDQLQTFAYQMTIVVTLAGVTGVSIASMASLWRAYLAFALPLLLTFISWVLWSNSDAGLVMALVGGVYMALLLLASYSQHQQLRSMLLLNRDNSRLLCQLKEERDQLAGFRNRIEEEQKLAEYVMHSITDLGELDELGIRYRMAPCSDFSGDVVLAARLEDGTIRLFMGDITGHGLSAAISAIPIAQTFNSMNRKGLEAEILLWELNRNLHHMLPTGMFCAAVLMELIPSEHGCGLRIWNGGMEDVLICRPRRGMINYVCSSHLALGILGTDSFSPDFEQFSLEPGDHILAYSDGLTEAMDERGEPFGRERVEEAVRVSFYSGESFDGVIEALRQFRGGAPQVDDILLVSMHCPAPQSDTTPDH